MALANFAVKARQSTRGWIPKTAAMWKRVFERITVIGDVRVASKLRTIAAPAEDATGFDVEFQRRLAKAAAAAAATLEKAAHQGPSDEEQAALQRLHAASNPARSAARTGDGYLPMCMRILTTMPRG